MAMDDDLLPSVPQLVARIEELEAAAAAACHVNTLLNQEVEQCMRAAEAAQADAAALRQRTRWLSDRLAAAHKQLRPLIAGQPGPFDEARALADMLNRLEAQAWEPSAQDLQSQPALDFQLSESQQALIAHLRAKGVASGWLIPHAEIQIGPVLGRGEFGVTYKATWRGATVAVKCVRIKDPREYTSFCRELDALCALRHPHVLPFLGACLTGPDGFWLVTEFMEQGTLAAWLYPHKYRAAQAQQQQQQHAPAPGANGTQGLGAGGDGAGGLVRPSGASGPSVFDRPKPVLDRVRMAWEVAQGLYALECLEPPLLHRDVKPSNIFVDGGGHARVGDLGLSRRLVPAALADLTGETGTYLYMAPEVMRHEVYDGKADVWSWGVLLVEALTLQTPYSWTYMTPEQIALAVADEQLSPNIPDGADVALQAIARLALGFNPEERPSFALITHEMGKAYNRMTAQAASNGPSLLGAVGRQLSSSWTSLLKRIYNTNPGMLPSTTETAGVPPHK